MATTIRIQGRPDHARKAASLFSHGAARLLSGLAAARNALRLRRDQRLMDELDDHVLADIGIGRHQIDVAVRCGRRGVTAEPVRPAKRRDAAATLPNWAEWR